MPPSTSATSIEPEPSAGDNGTAADAVSDMRFCPERGLGMTTESPLRPLRILSYLATQANPVSAAQIAQAVGAPRSSTFRLLRGMHALGYVTHLPEEKSYALGL